ncbi:MAG TPA: PstS family phosphate ABC transporter substrate-binding protein [Gaiellaceae bacterium]|nr:PstS family phosphate ABC transporter substrate-binding protein [Gaiellaceae bacterium]
MRAVAATLALLALLLAGCGRERPSDAAPTTTQSEEEAVGGFEEEALSGRIQADGSSTVAPLVTLAAERFRKQEPGVKISVGVSGTGGGFERFCAGETDLSDASRAIEDEEKAACRKKRVAYRELQVANDGLSVVVNADNDWVDCLTVDQLKKIWQPGSKVRSWKNLDPSFPDEHIELYGPGTDSGTFDYFTGAIVGEEGASRSDYSATEDDNVIVNGVSGGDGALGYIGLSYVEQNKGKLKAIAVDGGDGCVEPSAETVQDSSYKPLARPLFVYVAADALEERLEVSSFLTFLLENQDSLARSALFVPLTEEQATKSLTAIEGAGIDAGSE